MGGNQFALTTLLGAICVLPVFLLTEGSKLGEFMTLFQTSSILKSNLLTSGLYFYLYNELSTLTIKIPPLPHRASPTQPSASSSSSAWPSPSARASSPSRCSAAASGLPACSPTRSSSRDAIAVYLAASTVACRVPHMPPDRHAHGSLESSCGSASRSEAPSDYVVGDTVHAPLSVLLGSARI